MSVTEYFFSIKSFTAKVIGISIPFFFAMVAIALSYYIPSAIVESPFVASSMDCPSPSLIPRE